MKNEMTNNTEVKFERFCTRCGTKFETTSNRATMCPVCKEKAAEELKKKAYESNKARAKELGIVNVNLFKDSREEFKKYAEEHGITIPDAIREILKIALDKK